MSGVKVGVKDFCLLYELLGEGYDGADVLVEEQSLEK